MQSTERVQIANADLLIAGRYRLREGIGTGGTAEVYAADDLQTGQVVAVKLLRTEAAADPDYVDRFKREAQAAMALDHPRIVRAFDWGTTDSTYYLAMDYVAGSTLQQLIAERAPLREDAALRLVAEVADALAHAHGHGVIHRDVKPQNILLDHEGHVRLTDFGTARIIGVQRAQTTGFVLGTVQYLSPEQARGERVDQRSDIYSLGVVLYELLTGRLPFDGDTALSVALKQANEPVPSPRIWNPRLSATAETITFRALARDADRRFQTAGELAMALRGAQGAGSSGGIAAGPTGVVAGSMPDGVPRACAVPQPEAAPPSAGGRSQTRIGPRRPALAMHVPRFGLVAVLVLAAILVGLGAKLFAGAQQAAAQVAVPGLIGLVPEEAASLLANMGLELVVSEPAFSDTIPAGAIWTQSPGTGERLTRGSTIQVQLSLGEAPVVVPDLHGRQGSEIRDVLWQARLQLGATRIVASNSLTAGRVLDQVPEPGAEVPPNTAVDLVLSSGQPNAGSAVPARPPIAVPAQPGPAAPPAAVNRAPVPAGNSNSAADKRRDEQKEPGRGNRGRN